MSVRDEVLEALRRSTSEPSIRKAVYALEDLFTPNELKAALPTLDGMGDAVKAGLATSFAVRHMRRNEPEVYTRTTLRPDLAFYEGHPSRAGRALLFVLCGRLPRPMMANSLFVQHVPAQLFDIAIMSDMSNNHYVNGIEGYADGLFGLGQRLMEEFRAAEYDRVYFYGVSSGGLSAVRLGLLFKAFRSISIGGLFAWPIQRLRNGERFEAFDPICACHGGHRDDIVCVHATKQRDATAARQVIKAIGGQGLRITSTEDHNVIHKLFLEGRLGQFHRQILAFRPAPGGMAFTAPS